MALGKNIRKRSLIPDSKPEKKTKAKKKTPPVEKEVASGEQLPRHELVRGNFITKEAFEKRQILKSKFEADLTLLQASNSTQLISFSVGQQQYAFEILQTREVIAIPKIATMPHTPEFVAGISNVRGSSVLMIDLSKRFGFSSTQNAGYAIIIAHNEYHIGLMIEEVPRTVTVAGSTFKSAASILSDTTRDETYIKATVSVDDQITFLLDIEEFIEGNKIELLPTSLSSTTS